MGFFTSFFLLVITDTTLLTGTEKVMAVVVENRKVNTQVRGIELAFFLPPHRQVR